MKAKPGILKLLTLLCGLLAATQVFAQQANLYTWTGAANGTNADTFGNWVTNDWNTLVEYPATTYPNGHGPDGISPGDSVRWDGRTTTNLLVQHNTANWPNAGGSSLGLHFSLTANQTNSVQFYNPGLGTGTAQQFGLNTISNNSPNAALTFGNDYNPANSGNAIRLTSRPAAGYHYFYNNSTAPVTIAGSVDWLSGGGLSWTIEFGGTGDYNITNILQPDNPTGGNANGSITIVVHGPGNVSWVTNATCWVPSSLFGIGNVQIDAGKLILRSANLLGPRFGSTEANTAITNNATLAYSAPGQTYNLNRLIDGTGVLVVSNGTLVLSGANTYSGGTSISGGTLQVGTNGTSGSIGTGYLHDNGVLVFNRSDNLTFGGLISGAGSLLQQGSGKTTLTGDADDFTGTITVSNGTLVINNVNNNAVSTTVYGGTLGGSGTLTGSATLYPGTTLAPGASVGTLTIYSGGMSIGGNVAIEVDKTLSQSNDFVAVSGVLTNTGTGTLTVSNLGPALVAGDKFTLFSKPLSNGLALTITGGNATWTNNLAVDGSISVVIGPPVLNFTNAGSSLQFSWTGSFKLQSQTNTLTVGVSTNWGDYPGGGTSGVTVPVEATRETVFFRLVSP